MTAVRVALRVLPLLLLGVLLACLVALNSSSLTNYDTFFHLRIGEHFLTDWTPWAPGTFNQFAHAEWVPTQWFSEIWMAWTERHFGLAGVAWSAGLWMVGLALAVYLSCRREGSALTAATLAVFVMVSCTSGLSARPQVLSYLLMSMTVTLWLRTAQGHRAPYELIPLTWLWTLLHGMWLPGLVTSVVCAASVALASSDARYRRHVLLVPLVSALTPLLTPMGIGFDLYRAVAAVGANAGNVSEWAPAHFTSPTNAVLAAMLALTFGLLLLSARVRPIDAGLALLGLGWALYSQRTVPLAAVTLAPLLARSLRPYVRNAVATRTERVAILAMGLAALVTLAVTSSQAARIHQPSWVTPTLRSIPAGTPVLAEDAVSGYLVWAYPNLAPVTTGYFDMYDATESRAIRKVFELRPGWQQQVQRWGTTTALLKPSTPLAYALTHGEGWTVSHESKDIALLQAPSGWTRSQ